MLDHKVLWFEGKNQTKKWLAFAFFNNRFLNIGTIVYFILGRKRCDSLIEVDRVIENERIKAKRYKEDNILIA